MEEENNFQIIVEMYIQSFSLCFNVVLDVNNKIRGKMNQEDIRKSFLETVVNYAVVFRADIDAVNEIKEYLAHHPSIDVVYQKYSFSKLYIKESSDADDSKQCEN